MLWNLRWKLILLALMVVVFGLLAGVTLAEPECGQTQLDNDLGKKDLETYCADPTMDAGTIRTIDDDRDGDFDQIFIGTKGGGTLFGVEELDGRPEMELAVSDPTFPSARVRTADADSDGDVEVIWVGAQGLDLDKDGDFEIDEAGLIAGFADMDGNGDPEIVIADKARSLGDYYVGGFGIDKENADRFEVLWIGILNDVQRAAVGSIVSMSDADSDGDDEALVLDLSRSPQENYLDVDLDGDADIIIGVEL
ncbi:MAG: hypothetical protein A2Z21_07280 [Candidatus Fraserbacteria bacterium RBG_16_55_9]|uniref:VCBS repeat-containing protein n=1 Tax=Fraserbacteria sp. (strain RBG_16_55_9) TaxID=1817864 RepID=A0A1F5V0G3_FRAXR|nr:MAG: hypothetical protein A2Z21_07280 [Candidatus Fraserbacteria bacterium RBG_16_55_9]